jgi:hypothetical protein
MAMGIRRPGFQLLSIPPLYSQPHFGVLDQPCSLPDQIDLYIWIYIPALLCSIAFLALVRIRSASSQRTTDTSLAAPSENPDLDQGTNVSDGKPILPTIAMSKEVFRRSGNAPQASLLARTVWTILPSRWRIYLLKRSIPTRSSERGRIAAIMIDIAEVAWPIILFYSVLTLFVLW